MEDNQTPVNETHNPNSGVSFPTMNEEKKSGSPRTLLIVGILILVAILGFVIYKSASSKNSEITSEGDEFEDLTTPSSEQTFETFAPSPTATASPNANVDKAKVQIQVQNGTGITGEAAYLQTQLSNMGYTNVKVGNSDTNVNATTVTFSNDLDSGVVSEITQKLNAIYQTVTTKTSSSSTFDIVIVTGPRKGTTPRPSGSPTGTPRSSGLPSPTPTRSPSPTP